MEGWIKIHRKILENPIICKDSDYLAVWIYLLLNATHKEIPALFKGKKIILQKGQLIVGRKSMANQLKISESKIYRIINCFKSEQQIEQQTSNQNSLITVLNWDKYQQIEQQNEQQMNNERTTSEQRVNTNKNDKNVKNDKNNVKKNTKRKTFEDIFSENHFSEQLENTIKDFIDMRKTIKKPMTSKALELLIKNLEKLTNLEEEKIAILNQSIERSWQTVYPLKTDDTPKTNQTSKGNINDFKELMEEARNEERGNDTSNNSFGW